ncbi:MULTISPECIES: hypothetical protein [Ruminococcus]|uniref:hypothetical protein n=1 Tax=Ruminococcus TaxID=1263 RepID=UPI001FA8B504|nr:MULTISPECIES: hypothetical protein [Ruminococcus]
MLLLSGFARLVDLLGNCCIESAHKAKQHRIYGNNSPEWQDPDEWVAVVECKAASFP